MRNFFFFLIKLKKGLKYNRYSNTIKTRTVGKDMTKEKNLNNLKNEELIEIINKTKKRLNAYEYNITLLNNQIKSKDNQIKNKDNQIKRQNEQIKKQALEIELDKAKEKKLLDEIEELKLKYENELEIVKRNNFEKYVKKSEKEEKNIVNEVEKEIDKKEEKEKKPRKTPKEKFVKELEKLSNKAELIIDYDFEKNGVDKEKVKPFGEDITYKIEMQPTPIKITKVVRKKYKDKNNIYETPSNDVFPHSPLTPSFAANIIIYKYELFVPLYRYSQYFKAISGVDISTYNLSNYVKRATEKLMPLYDELKSELLKNQVLHIDETTLKVLEEKDRTNCYVFAYRTSHWTNEQICLYEFNESRQTDKVKEMLENYRGYIIVDGYSGYDFLKQQGVKVQRCWVHIRRYFNDALKILSEDEKKKSPAYKIYSLINELFSKEKQMTLNEKTINERKEIRNSKEYLNILENIDKEVEELKNKNLNDGLINKALTYYTNIKNKGELTTFLEDGIIEIDNNLAERTVKPFVIGRKNFLFCKTKSGADVSSVLYSIVQTAKINGINVETYLAYALENIDKINDINKLMPWDEKIQEEFSIKN